MANRPELTLRIAAGDHGHMDALRHGDVRPRAVRLDHVEVAAIAPAFVRMVRGLEYDVCEMTFGTYLCAKSLGTPLTALPVFVLRGVHHGAILRPVTSSIAGPRDLVGRRVGVGRGWTRTAGIWARGILADDYGVDLHQVEWVVAGDEDVPGYQPPGMVVRWPDSSILDLVRNGDLAAATGVRASSAGMTPLIADADEAAFRALRQRGLYPINHLIVVRSDLLLAHPGIAVDLFEACAESKRRYVESLASGERAPRTEHDHFYLRVMETTGSDPLPYGVPPNLAMIEELTRHAVSQGVVASPVEVEQLFAPGTLDLLG